MALTFTPQQQKVIDLHNRNILVSAAAGSGKTAVLVERIIQMICDEAHPVDIDRLLVVTFTNAAAAEMRERIGAGIAARLEQAPQSEHMQRQSALLHNARIMTIDSFCLFLLRNHFHEIGLDPAFRVADEGEIKLLQQDVLKELLEDSFREGSRDFYHCVEYFCPGGRESVLEQHILNLWRCASSHPWPEDWLLQRKQDYSAHTVEELCESGYGRYLLSHLAKLTEGCAEGLERVKGLCQEPDGPYMYGELAETELEAVRRLSDCKTLEEYGTRLSTLCFGRLPSKKDDSVSLAKREMAKNLRGRVKDTLKGVAERFFKTPLSLALIRGEACLLPVNTLIDLTLAFSGRLQQKKQEKKLVDFADIEHLALQILLKKDKERTYPTNVALEYRRYFHEILIDEYQDSNLVQEYLLKAISGEEDGNFNRFMVGDVKQSIYKFRLARPELFMEKYDSYGTEADERTRIDLSKNFRSRSQVVDTVNGLFERMMSRNTGGIDYDERAALYPGASYPENADCESEFVLAEKPEKDTGIGAKAAEGRAIAERIKQLKASFLVTDRETGKLRPVRFSDMVILLRTNSGWDEELKKVLEEQGIPVHITSKTGYFAAPEVQELLQLLRTLDNPYQDIPLYSVLQSRFGDFTVEEIALLRAGKKQGSLYEALCASGDDKAAAFLQKLEEYRDCAVYMPVRELLQKLLHDFDYLNYVTALPAGGKRRANVEMLLTKASDFEKTSYFGLFHFVRYMEQLEKYDVDYGEADTLDENADVVRMMSIHKSKGLEFPVVFAAGMGKRFNMQDANQSLIVDMDLGLAVDFVDTEKRIRSKTLRRAVLACKMREDSLAEELRVLYVALTRAKEKLIMTGCLEDAAEKWELFSENGKDKLSYLDFVEAESCLAWLLPIAAAAHVKVSVFAPKEALAGEMREQADFWEKKVRLEQADWYGDDKELEALRERLSWKYPRPELERLYTKTTVSELKTAAMADKDEAAYHTFQEKEVTPYIPSFRRKEEKVDGTVRGNAFHRVMELLDFKTLLGAQFEIFPESYESYVRGLSEERLLRRLHEFLEEEAASLRLSRVYFEAVNEKKLVRFLQTKLAYRMWKADIRGALYREQPFVLGVPAERLSRDFPKEETVLIQGIIDVFFEEEDGLVLLDYKTDVIASMEELWKRYEVQLDYYREALERILEKQVKERVLYSFYLETDR